MTTLTHENLIRAQALIEQAADLLSQARSAARSWYDNCSDEYPDAIGVKIYARIDQIDEALDQLSTIYFNIPID